MYGRTGLESVSDVLFASLEVDALILNAVIAGTGVHKDCADIASKSPAASMHRSSIQIGWTVHI